MIKTLKDQVEYILEKIPETRNSDKRLTIELWKRFTDKIGLDNKVNVEDIMELPSQDGIKRVRCVIQNDEGRLLPTRLDVVKKRGQNEREWRIALGYSVEDVGQQTMFEEATNGGR